MTVAKQSHRADLLLRTFVVVISVEFVPSLAMGFSMGNHEKITTSALNQVAVSSTNGKYIGFTPDAIANIARANKMVDVTTLGGIRDSVPHFDDGGLRPGANYIKEKHDAILLAIKFVTKASWDSGYGGAQTTDMNNAVRNGQQLLGQALHTIQDFYAHTTWIELGKTGTIAWGEADPGIFLGGVADPCTDGTWVTPGSYLTSEYFVLPPLQPATANLRECVHGPSSARVCGSVFELSTDFCTNLLNVTKDGITLNGINKDTIVRPRFTEASVAAEQATATFTTKLLDEIAQYSPNAACLFSGNNTECAGDVVVYTLASGGCYPGISCNVSTGVLSTPKPIEVRSTTTTTSTLSGTTTTNNYVSSAVQVTYLFENGAPLRVYVPRKICRKGNEWIPRNYSWSVETFTPINGYSAGDGEHKHFYGALTLNAEGDAIVTYNRDIDSHSLYTEPTYARYTQSVISYSFDRTTYNTNLNSGAGNWTTTTDASNERRDTAFAPPFVSGLVTNNTTTNGQESWPAEAAVPPALLGVYLLKIRVASTAEGIPPECTAQ